MLAGVDCRAADGLVLAVDLDEEVAADLAVPAVPHQHRLAVDRVRVPPGRVDEARVADGDVRLDRRLVVGAELATAPRPPA